jgi:hypothetical protein
MTFYISKLFNVHIKIKLMENILVAVRIRPPVDYDE